jgi:hypothetical protein
MTEMEDGDDVLVATVDELVLAFRSAVTAMIPAADRIKLYWQDDFQHRDWERLVQVVFDSFVRSPIGADRSGIGDEFPLPPYDIDLEDYAGASWIGCRAGAASTALALVRFLSRGAPLDTVQAVEVDPVSMTVGQRVELDYADVHFFLVRRRENGTSCEVERIEAVE